ncbi:DUF5686 family protein [Nonlabens xiamenensis]|uniref:DUF5686 family protein n=1 Tax=Nonlabens xiamenensis TaxID=2341043 RepID=UPI001F0C76CE|nr:DUF5686 family protein [Nonlabens xiamenensis]
MKFFTGVFILFLSLVAPAQNDSAFPVDDLITKVLISKKKNNPRHKFNSFQYNSYEILKVSGDPEALTGPGYKKTELRKTLKKTGVLFAEKTSKHIHDHKEGYKEIITGAYMPGFDEPVYPIYNINFQSEHLYKDTYIILDQAYKNPLGDDGKNFFNFKRISDSLIDGRPVTKVGFRPKNVEDKSLLSGYLYIDQLNFAVARAILETTGDININANHDFVYDPALEVWLESSRSLSIRKEKTKKELELFGGRLEVGLERDNKKNNTEPEELYLIIQARNTDFKTNKEITYGRRGLEIEVLDSAITKKESYWKEYRNNDSFSTTELASFVNLDSIVDASRITRRLETLDKFKIGYYPVGIFDIDLKYLVKFNDYEAFRVGIGGQTNEKLSDSFRVGGYLAYGTKDDTFKYNINLGYRLNEEKNTWLNIYREDDITEFAAESFLTDARVYSLFEPRLINIPTFYLYREYGLSLQQRLFPSVISEVLLSRKRINQTTAYQFAPEADPNDALGNYTLSEIAVGVRWSPVSKFMRTPNGYQETERGYPILSGQLTQGIKGLAGSNFNYLKLSGKIAYTTKNLNNSSTDLSLEGHYGTGRIPLTHLYHAYPNAPNKDELLQRFSVAGRRSFETMFFNEFFSDKLLIGQVKHRLAPFKIFPFLQPEMVLITRAAWGDLEHPDRHLNIDFKTLDRGYFESGFELNKLLFGFGLSFTYRHGPYHLSDFEDNLAMKFTFYLEL